MATVTITAVQKRRLDPPRKTRQKDRRRNKERKWIGQEKRKKHEANLQTNKNKKRKEVENERNLTLSMGNFFTIPSP
jgi:hypothetical protein